MIINVSRVRRSEQEKVKTKVRDSTSFIDENDLFILQQVLFSFFILWKLLIF